MLSKEEIREIAAQKWSGGGVVSLYLNVNPVTDPGGQYAIWLKNAIKSSGEGTSPELLRTVEKDFAEIEDFVRQSRRDFKKGFVALSSSENGFWRAYHLAVALKNELIVDKAPYLKPLLNIIEQYRRYAVLLVDKERARIFVIHLGEIAEYGEVHSEDVPGKHKKGGWFSLAQTHYARHIDYHVGLHLKDVIKRFEPFLASEDIGRLIVGGPEEAVQKTMELLPRSVTEKLIGTFQAGMHEGSSNVLKKAEPVLRKYEGHQETKTVDELVARAMKDERAVIGLKGVLDALQEGRVQKLVLERDARASGQRCSSCGALSADDMASCPYCGGSMERLDFIIDHAAQRAVEQQAPVIFVSPGDNIRNAGSVGAFLRF